MKEMLEKRLGELKAELAAGENLLGELQAKQVSLQQTLLRISGAIQVLEEMLAREPTPSDEAPSAGGSPGPSHS